MTRLICNEWQARHVFAAQSNWLKKFFTLTSVKKFCYRSVTEADNIIRPMVTFARFPYTNGLRNVLSNFCCCKFGSNFDCLKSFFCAKYFRIRRK